MILDAILLTVAEVSADGKAKMPPEMRLTTGDGVNIGNMTTKFQVWLTSTVE